MSQPSKLPPNDRRGAAKALLNWFASQDMQPDDAILVMATVLIAMFRALCKGNSAEMDKGMRIFARIMKRCNQRGNAK